MLEGLQQGWAQMFSPVPAFTEQSIGDLSGRVYFVTDGDTGDGKEVARILYSKNARVYVGCRSEEGARGAFDDIRRAHPDARGSLAHQALDLSDLVTVRASAEAFAAREATLDVLFNHAPGADATPGGPLLLAMLLTPTLVASAARAASGAVRVVWASAPTSHYHAREYARMHGGDAVASVVVDAGGGALAGVWAGLGEGVATQPPGACEEEADASERS